MKKTASNHRVDDKLTIFPIVINYSGCGIYSGK